MKFYSFIKQPNKVKRSPKISFKEMCEEFSVAPRTLLGALKSNDAPKSILDHKFATNNNTWYEPHEVRKWWKERQERLVIQKPNAPTV